MNKYSKTIDLFFRDEMCLPLSILRSRSKSPNKPQQLINHIRAKKLEGNFNFREDFEPFEKEDFYIAHNKSYVDKYFVGDKDTVSPILIEWSEEMCKTVKWTNSSLYHSILNSIKNPKTITLSPVSGFHHAVPFQGYDFCSFSGQVIASSKIYEEYGLSGCYIDLDVHYGNSIEDSRKFVENLNRAIPKGFNINPMGHDGNTYIKSLSKSLEMLKTALLEKKIDYVVLCHGADSHKDDDLKVGCLTTEEWLLCSEMVYSMIEEVNNIIGNVPLILSLFGGYREDNYEFVLDLHLQSILNSIK